MSLLLACLKEVGDMDLSILADAGMAVPELDYRKVLTGDDYVFPQSLASYVDSCEQQMGKYARMIDRVDGHTPHWRHRAYVFRYEMARRELLAIYKHLAEFTEEDEKPTIRQILWDHLTPRGHIIASELVEELEQDALKAGFIKSAPPEFAKPLSFDVRRGPETQGELNLQKRFNDIRALIIRNLVGF